ncbi:hypothetical protein ACB092_09G138100 [Castanea dentata]
MSWIFEVEISGESISVQPLTSKTAIITNKISRSYTYMLFTAPNTILQASPCRSCMKRRYDLGGKNPKNYAE